MRIGAILDTGTPLSFVADVLGFDVRTLRKQLKAAGVPPRPRDAMQAVGYAMRRLREHDEQHPESFFEPEIRTREALEEHANRLELVLELCRAQATAGGKAWDGAGLEGTIAALRAEAA